MSLKETIRSQILIATKTKQEHTKNVLKVVLGEANTQEARNNKPLTDEDYYRIIRKTLQGIEEMLQYKPEDTGLLEEKNILNNLLPKQLNTEDIIKILMPKNTEIMNAKSDGQATGIAMKYMKELKLSVDGNMISIIIKELRK